MNGDFSRSTFRTYKQYSSVRMQQGRVQLDADWNEAEDIRRHVERSAFRDAIGLNGVPKKASGFAVGVTPDGTDLTIAAGRMYVDGLLVEMEAEAIPVDELYEDRVVLPALHADGRKLDAPQWIELYAVGVAPVRTRIASVDAPARTLRLAPPLSADDVAALGKTAFARRVTTYGTQPELPGAPSMSTAAPPALTLPAGTYLAFADVWERHVTALDDPELRETALGGPDTSTRTKVVCQVRLEAIDDPTVEHCDQAPDPAALLDARGARHASSGRMQARAVPGDPATEPCDLSAGGGYRRLENQLYRVEVHTSGPLATATFKWSRDNASMTARWLGQVGSKLQVSSQGPDDVLGFASGQMVELIDDTRELKGAPGTLVSLVAPPEGNVLSIDPSVTVDRAAFPGNPKVRRWDSTAEVAAAGSGGGGWIALEDGVEVRFDDGWYNTGDYWLVPARTPDGNVEWPSDAGGRPVPRGPDGVAHHYAKLALLRSTETAITVLEDCRDPFPALTDLAAVDVTYDNSACQLPGAHTVQDALDRLCEEHTLRRHKKTLHGWGIVCGLQVVCGGEDDGRRNAVVIRDGYAIDAEGNDLLLEKDTRFDVVQKIQDYRERHPDEERERPLLNDGNGEVSLFMQLDRDRNDLKIDIERFDPNRESDPDTLLAGTMLMDFYKECILPVETFFRKELGGEDREGPVIVDRGDRIGRVDRGGFDRSGGGLSPAHQRRSILVSLIAHFLNQKSGQLIYVSAQEDEILRAFYGRLKELLTSETFCAMFENARPFPDYPLADVPMTTIFGRGNHTRVRLRPGKIAEAYTVGPGFNPKGPTIAVNRYDLKRGEYVASIDPIAGNRIAGRFKKGTDAVRDVAFSKDGKRIYAIAPTRNGRDTFFRAGDIEADEIKWGELHTICGVRLTTLGTTAKDPSGIYAIGLGSGLYRINPDSPDLSPSPVAAFNATGQMAITADGRAVALGASGDAGRGIYDRLYSFTLPDGAAVFDAVSLDAGGRDEAGVAVGGEANVVFVAVGNKQRSVQAFDARSGQRMQDKQKQPLSIPVGDGPVALEICAETGVLLVAMEDAYRVRLIDLKGMKLIDEFVPAQVGPASIAVDERTKAAYILNAVSSTITVAGFDLLHAKLNFPYEALAAYRRGILNAFVDLTGGFLQYLKDCLCDHFLVRTPEPTGDEKIYLAAVSMRDEQVYKVCNFSKRRYVKSFPAVGYWLSLVPIAPMIDRLVETFCCWIIPDQFGRFASREFEADSFAQATSGRFGPSSLRTGAFASHELDPMSKLMDLVLKLKLAASQMMSGFGTQNNNYAAPTPPAEDSEVAGSSVGSKSDAAESKFLNEGILVEKKPYRAAGMAKPTDILRAAFVKPRPGDTVQIFEEKGVVKGITVLPATMSTRMAEGPAPVTQPVVTQPVATQPVVTQPVDRVTVQPEHVVVAQPAPVAVQPEVLAELNDLRARLDLRESELNVMHMRLAAMDARHDVLSGMVRERSVEERAVIPTGGVIVPEGGAVVREETRGDVVREDVVTPAGGPVVAEGITRGDVIAPAREDIATRVGEGTLRGRIVTPAGPGAVTRGRIIPQRERASGKTTKSASGGKTGGKTGGAKKTSAKKASAKKSEAKAPEAKAGEPVAEKPPAKKRTAGAKARRRAPRT